MSLELLLGELTVPLVPREQSAREPLKTASISASSPGSPGSPDKTSPPDETLVTACRGLSITPAEVREALAPEDINGWRNGGISNDSLAALAQSLMQRREMEQGKRPVHFTEHASCQHCGPIWLWFSGRVLGCPWCWNRVADRPIPRPHAVRCGDCIHFERIDDLHLGHCQNLLLDYGTQTSDIASVLPNPKQTNNDQTYPK